MRVLEVRAALTAITRTVVGVLDRRVCLLRHAKSSWKDPALADRDRLLASDGSKRRQLEEKFPTRAFATLAYRGPWAGLGPARAELIGFVLPRDLES